MQHHHRIWIFLLFRLYEACTYINHGSYKKGYSSDLLYTGSGTVEYCKTQCTSNPLCKGFGRLSGSCYFSSSSVPASTTCSGCSFYTKDNCDTTTETTTEITTEITTGTTTETTGSSKVSTEQQTTLQSTTAITQNGTGQPLCRCICSENGTIPAVTLTSHESLLIDKKGLSSYRKSKICISDNRTSALALGSLGVGIIALFALLILLPDAVRFLRFVVGNC